MEVVLPHFQIGSASVSLGVAAAAYQAAVTHVSNRKYEHTGGTALAAIPRAQLLAAEKALELRSPGGYLHETVRRLVAPDPVAMPDVLGINARRATAALA